MLQIIVLGLLALGIIAGLIYLIYKLTQKKIPVTNQPQTPPPPDPAHGTQAAQAGHGAGHDDHGHAKTTKADDAGLMFTAIAILVILFFAVVGVFNYCSDDKKPKVRYKVTQPATYTERHLLKVGQVVKVNIPSQYNMETNGFGNKYYYESESVPKVLIGGGEPAVNNDGKDTYVNLSAYEKDIEVLCTFKPK